jgi:predicted RNA-binding Zn ribbon-like protein
MTGVTASFDRASRREPAPGGLELVRALINSFDIEDGTDEFATAMGVDAWLRSRDLPLGENGTSESERRRLLAFREALRELITCRELGISDGVPLDVLGAAARSSPLTVAFDAGGHSTLQPTGTGVAGLIGRVLVEISTASVGGTWARLKVCRNDACRWAFYDASRNHSGIWCSMAVCGNRSKVRALRDRRRDATATG